MISGLFNALYNCADMLSPRRNTLRKSCQQSQVTDSGAANSSNLSTATKQPEGCHAIVRSVARLAQQYPRPAPGRPACPATAILHLQTLGRAVRQSLPSSASHTLYRTREAEAGSPSNVAIREPSDTVIVLTTPVRRCRRRDHSPQVAEARGAGANQCAPHPLRHRLGMPEQGRVRTRPHLPSACLQLRLSRGTQRKHQACSSPC
jgi:hypothetical protein